MPVTRDRIVSACRAIEVGATLGELLGKVQRLTQEDLQNAVVDDADADVVLVGWVREAVVPAAQPPAAPPGPVVASISTVLGKRYMEHAPSSYDVKTWARAQALNRAEGIQSTEDPLFLCHRPPWAAGMAAPLMHPAFGRFLDAARDSTLPTRKDTNFTTDLCHAGLVTYEDEAKRQTKMEGLFNAYVGEDVSKFTLAGGRTMDGFIGDRRGSKQGVSWCAAIIEFENELGATKTDKYFQGQCYYAQMCVGNKGVAARLMTCFPTLLAEWQGPFLRISAMGYLNQVHTAPLTPHLMLAVLPDEHQRLQLVCTLTALRLCIRDLQLFYRDYLSAMQHEGPRHPALELPAPWPLYMDHGSVQLSSRLSNIQLIKPWSVYSAEFEQQQQHGGHARIPVIIKFTQRYGKAVHAAWADAHLAPPLLEVVSLPGGWLMVVMEQLVGSWVRLADVPAQQQTAARQAAAQALEAAHQVPIPGYTRAGVHGDARGINIMVCPGTSHQPPGATPAGGSSYGQDALWQVKFIDFDWAGEDGVTTYPAFMSREIPWAEGAGDLRVMRQEHDVHLLQQPLWAPAMMFYNWRQGPGP